MADPARPLRLVDSGDGSRTPRLAPPESAALSDEAPASNQRQIQISLTPRQREVLRLVALGLTAEEIGNTLGISPRTARAHTDVLKQKVGALRSRHVARAYWNLTGRNPLDPHPSAGGPPTTDNGGSG